MSAEHRNPIRAGDIITDGLTDHIFEGVQSRTLPRMEWTHPAHLVFATALLSAEGLNGAEAKMPAMIRAYNESVGGLNDDTQGYHHTITLFFLRHIDAFLKPFAAEPVGMRATRLLVSPLSATDYPLRYYSKERLFSLEARRNWVEPDL